MYRLFLNFKILLLLVKITFFMVKSLDPTSEDSEILEPLRKNVTECAQKVNASTVEVENFFARVPQTTVQGKCFVACILEKYSMIINNKIVKENVLEANKVLYQEGSEDMDRLNVSIIECLRDIEAISDICEYASTFNDCMCKVMEQVLDDLLVDRHLEALRKTDEFIEDDGENSQNPLRDEL